MFLNKGGRVTVRRREQTDSEVQHSFTLPIRYLPPAVIRELPDRPQSVWRIIGPGLVASGVGLASGEFIMWPYIASQVGLVFLWGALVGVVVQWFINMEIERYTLATGETALTGFSRLWKHWGLVFAIMVYFANLWPGWVSSSATMVTFIAGGQVTPIAVSMLLLVGVILTLAPVVYTALERLIFVKLAVIGGFAVLAFFFAVKVETWESLSAAVNGFGRFPGDLPFSLMMGAIVFAGAGGGQNLCQSNWIRDKGFGMGAYVPRLESAVTGAKRESRSIEGYVFPLTQSNLRRWSRWWTFANLEQALSFVLVTVITIIFTSMLAHSTLFGRPDLPNNINFLRIEGDQLGLAVGGWFRVLFWVIGAFSLFAASVGIVDLTSRLAADVDQVNLLARLACPRKHALFLARVGIGGVRVRYPPRGLRPAADPACHLRLRGWRDDVHPTPSCSSSSIVWPCRRGSR